MYPSTAEQQETAPNFEASFSFDELKNMTLEQLLVRFGTITGHILTRIRLPGTSVYIMDNNSLEGRVVREALLLRLEPMEKDVRAEIDTLCSDDPDNFIYEKVR